MTSESTANRQILSGFGVDAYKALGIYGAGVKVYVIDTGLNAITPDTAGITVVGFAGNLTSSSSHGAAIASLIAAPANNYGVIGVAPECTLILADVDEEDGDIFDTYVAEAIDDAISRQVDIISISLGTSTASNVLRGAVNRALAEGILVFAAAGNGNRSSAYEYPASFAGVISVASCDVNRNLSSFTTFNDRVRLIAPGETWVLPTGFGYASMQGTSFSTPFCAALAALALSKKRVDTNDATFRYTDAQIVSILEGPQHLSVRVSDIALTSAEGNGAGIVLVIIAIAVVFALTQERNH